MQAFYYWGDYYLIPGRYKDLKEFLRSEEIKKELSFSKLNEKGCIAPYFIKEEITEEQLFIDETLEVYPADVTVLSRDEYLLKLKETANTYCQGCKKYRNDTALLADELTLDGICYEDEDDIRDQLKDAVDGFWSAFLASESDLRQKLDAEDPTPASTLEALLHFLPGVYVCTREIKDRYYLMVSSLFDQYLSLLCEYLIQMAPSQLKERWDFYSYLPQNIYKYIPNDKLNVLQNPPLIRFSKKKADRPRFDITLKLHPCDDAEIDVLKENLLYIFAILGENRFYAALSSLNCDMEYETGREGFVHIKDYSVEILKEYMEHLRMYFRRFHYGELPLTKEQSLGRRKDNQLVTTNCDTLTQGLLSNRPNLLNGMNQYAGYIGTITFDFGCNIQEYSPLLRGIHDQIEDVLYTPGYVIPFSTCYGTTKVYVDFILADINKARRAIRSLTPLLKRYHAIYTETTSYGSNSYHADYELGTHEA